MIDDLKIIKKKYGEEMMHFCRDAFATILEEPGVLSDLLLTYFEPSKELFSDLQTENLENNFKSFIYRKFNNEEQVTITETKTPQELLSSVGYDLYKCESEEDIQKFKKYYAKGEELCTFNGDRLNKCYVFFAVKKDVDNIKREDFKTPERQDLYGTSVISIQFDKNEAHTLSIKNRYNHTVANPDATFSNNLDNIVEGLTDSFALHYDLKQKHVNEFEIPDYIRDYKGKYYKYNYEIEGVNYCPNNCILLNHEAIKFPKDRYILADYFLIDRQEKTIKCFNQEDDYFPKFFKDNPISKIDLEIKDNVKLVKIETTKGLVTLELDKRNRIIGLTNPYIEKIESNYLYYNKSLSKIELPQVKIIGNNFLANNQNLKEIDLPKVHRVGYDFLHINELLDKINMPNVLRINMGFLMHNNNLKEVDLPKVESIGSSFLKYNKTLERINIPNALEIDNYFLDDNEIISQISLPNVKIIGSNFLANNKSLIQIELPKVERIDNNFLYHNESLSNISLPNVKTIGYRFLCHNQNLKEIDLPNVEIIDSNFLDCNQILEKINMPNVVRIEHYFMHNNNSLTKIYLPKIKIIGMCFLQKNKWLEEVIIDNEKAYQDFLWQHPEYQERTLTRKLTKGKK